MPVVQRAALRFQGVRSNVGTVLAHLVPTPLQGGVGTCQQHAQEVLAHGVLTAGSRGVIEHIGDVLGASFCQDDVKKCSSSLKIARNRSNFVARFRSHANMCSNSVPTAALAGVRTLCQQQSQGKCWHTERANSRRGCANVRTEALVHIHIHTGGECRRRGVGQVVRTARAFP